MDAIVSGSAGIAVLIEGESLSSVRRTQVGFERTPRRSHDLRHLFGDARDLTFLENVEDATVLEELDLSHAGVKAIHLALMLCDPEASDRVAGLAADEIEPLLNREAVAERAERILDATPLGPRAAPTNRAPLEPVPPLDLSIAIVRCRARGRKGVIAFFEALLARQPVIAEVRRAWDVLPASLFADSTERAIADSLLAREGLFRSLVRSRITNASVDAWLANARSRPTVLQGGAGRWVEAWAESLRHATVFSKTATTQEASAFTADVDRTASRSNPQGSAAPPWLKLLPNRPNFFSEVRHRLTTPNNRSAAGSRRPAYA